MYFGGLGFLALSSGYSLPTKQVMLTAENPLSDFFISVPACLVAGIALLYCSGPKVAAPTRQRAANCCVGLILALTSSLGGGY